MAESPSSPIRCVWCEIELAPKDAKPIIHARLPRLPDEENMQCKDYDACVRRQDALSAASIIRSRVAGDDPLFIRVTPGVQAVLDDGDALRAALARLNALDALEAGRG